MPQDDKAVGFVFGSSMAPEHLVPLAVSADDVGIDEIWFSEDCFFTGGISAAAAALASTQRVKVGLGVVSAMLRQPALLAMEVATMARAFPGRLRPGIGLGVPAWLRQLGREPSSPVTALTETVTALGTLLAGGRVDSVGKYHSFHGVALEHPPTTPVPIHMGVVGPRMLRLSGQLAGGSILSVCAGAEYVRWARDQVDVGRQEAGRDDPHRITAFAIYAVDHDRDAARAQVRAQLGFYLGAGGPNAITDVQGISEPLREMIVRGGSGAVTREMPDSWIDELTVSGTPEDCAERIERLLSSGADSVALFPAASEGITRAVPVTAREVLPLLTARGSRR